MNANFDPGRAKESATLTTADRRAELGLLAPSIGAPMLDVRTLHDQIGMYTYDPSFAATGSCDSGITYVDGEKGVLLYRGYPIDQLVERSDFLEVAYLLLNGELPAPTQKAKFCDDITRHTMVHEQLRSIYQGFRRDAHPMAVMCGVVGALSAFYHDSLDIFDPRQRMISSHRMIAKMPTIAAMAYKYSIGQPFVYPRNDLGFSANFLNMMFSVPCEPYEIKPAAVRAIEALMIIQADHEQNASTSTVRMVGSSRANPYACIAAGIASLWGPIHGGANQEALEMLEAMGTVERIPEFLARAKDKNDPFRLMGFGHRVYKSYDPRAKVMRKICNEVLEQYDRKDDPVLQLAKELERIALDDEYFVSRKLYPNVDFYSGIIMRTLGIPTSMFTVLFAVARTVGWVAHWNEMISDPGTRIFRPRQLYTGPVERDFVAASRRVAAAPLVG